MAATFSPSLTPSLTPSEFAAPSATLQLPELAARTLSLPELTALQLPHPVLPNLTLNDLGPLTAGLLAKFPRDDILSFRLLPLRLDKVRITPSPIHGRGVFASRPISQDEVITLYPGDFVIFQQMGGRLEAARHVRPDRFADMTIPAVRQLILPYLFDIDPEISIVGDPELTDNPTYLGHLINDGAKAEKDSDRDQYESLSQARANSRPVRVNHCLVAIQATRNIEKGEEILFFYTYEYWQTQAE